ncbi:MAG: hypothetical protein COA84_03200 [Robiginitomaculum sp.]|nr:MAG: hypothetical protein COA84_03200 [Robiginitomaculum sp.]
MTEGIIEICAVLVAADAHDLSVLTLGRRASGQGYSFSLPAAPFNPERGQSFEDRLRDWASVHTTAQITRIMQIGASTKNGRVRIGLLALVSDRNAFMPRGARWTPIAEVFPWEDWRGGPPDSLTSVLRPALAAGQAKHDALFARQLGHWRPELAAARFEALYGAGLLPEALRDRSGAMILVRERHAAIYGQIMQGDDRKTIAMALSHLRTELGRAPVLSALLPSPFTLGVLQNTVEAIIGLRLHTQNFRRDLARTDLVVKTGKSGRVGNSRPGQLWTWAHPDDAYNALPGMPLPRKTSA